MIENLKRGQRYKTRGGWTAICIWVNANDLTKGGYCIHKPGDEDNEDGPIYHWGDGTAHALLAVLLPPVYDIGHPADLMEEIE